MNDDTADFESCHINFNTRTPYCTKHGAMICVKKEGIETVWRCIQSTADDDCKSGCVMIKDKSEYAIKTI